MANSKYSKTDVQQVKNKTSNQLPVRVNTALNSAVKLMRSRLESKTNLLNKTNSKTANH